jgi:hypothetical protein
MRRWLGFLERSADFPAAPQFPYGANSSDKFRIIIFTPPLLAQ